MEWEWLIWTPIALMALLCPLMMVGMMVGGWLFARGRGGQAGHAGHGMMMCHGGHDAGHDERGETSELVSELKAQRERIDRILASAEEGALRRGP